MQSDEKSSSDKRKDTETIANSGSGFDQRGQKIEGDQYNFAGNFYIGYLDDKILSVPYSFKNVEPARWIIS